MQTIAEHASQSADDAKLADMTVLIVEDEPDAPVSKNFCTSGPTWWFRTSACS
jgi:hypothetical protein